MAEFWATLPQTGPKLGRPRDRNSSWGVTNRFLSSDLCSAMDSAQVDWPKKHMTIRITYKLHNTCNRGTRDPSMWWGSSIQIVYLRFVSPALGFVSKSRSVSPYTNSGSDPGVSFASCTGGRPVHESWIMNRPWSHRYISENDKLLSLTTDLLWPLQGQTLEWPIGRQFWHHAGYSGEAARTLQFARRKNPKLETMIFRCSALWGVLKPKVASLQEIVLHQVANDQAMRFGSQVMR